MFPAGSSRRRGVPVRALGTILLMLPAARAGVGAASPLTALFTATSAVCVTGLAVVDTPTYWSPLGQVVILGLMQVGGFGIMTMATMLGLLVSRRGLGLRTRLVAQAESHTLNLGDLRSVLARVALATVLFEAATFTVLTGRFRLTYMDSWGTAAWHGLFHAVSAFNNAGFALYTDSMVRFGTDGWVLVPLAVAVLAGGLGFPVLIELRREFRRPSTWSVHTKLTVFGSGVLLVLGMFLLLTFEWVNPRTVGPLGVPGKLLTGFFHAVMPRSGGFNSVDVGAMRPESLVTSDILMFIGGGSASTAGGIKLTTFFLLAFVIWAEVRGEADVVVFHRRVSTTAQRQALAVALLGMAFVTTATVALLALVPHSLDQVLFEAISAFATVGLSTGITPTLPPGAQLVLVILMFVGRVGTITVATALALRSRPRLFRRPEERPIVG
jgi:trk system potassium uptake protein